MGSLDGLEMDSNVGRDVLSTASSFGTLPKAVAEYVANSIGNGEDGQHVNVKVTKRRSYGSLRMVIEDDACGMDDNDLRRFFSMHAENEARRQGRATGGRFGTGKTAAFGVGESLQVETRRYGHKWVVRLEKSEIIAAAKEKRAPKPDVQVDGVATDEPNGTTIIIDRLTKSADAPKIIQWLRRRSGRALNAHNVVVEGDRAVVEEPNSRRTWEFRSAKAEPDIQAAIGADVVCTISSAVQQRVDDSIQGVTVTSLEFPVAQVLAVGDHASRIFGHCEVPALEADDSTPSPYLDTRDYILNEDNRTAGPLLTWLRECLVRVVADIAADERDRRRRAQDAALRNAASRMEAVLNRHFQGEFRKPRNPVGDVGTKIIGVVPNDHGDLVRPGEGFTGYDIPEREPRLEDSTSEQTTPRSGPELVPEPGEEPIPRLRDRDPFGNGRGEGQAQTHETRRRRPTGGFKIAFENATEIAPRSRYLESELMILVNLDHPEMAAAHREGDTPLFRMLTFEAAALEYCYATAYVRMDEDASIDPSDIVEYVRTTIDDLTRDVSEVVGDLTTIPMLGLATAAAG
ncbi:MAG TPA: ATP-binding protein [Candidatus Acidoferrales bacterium]|nr:ATP-binding protein [Candidatus Acidoferrales bacterium]